MTITIPTSLLAEILFMHFCAVDSDVMKFQVKVLKFASVPLCMLLMESFVCCLCSVTCSEWKESKTKHVIMFETNDDHLKARDVTVRQNDSG